MKNGLGSALVLALGLAAGLLGLGLVVGRSAVQVKKLDRTVVVKGLSEREVPADVAIWPMTLQVASNDLGELFTDLQDRTSKFVEFLGGHGIEREAISTAPPAVLDAYAQNYAREHVTFRYTATATVTVYSEKVDAVRAAMADVIELGKRGVVLSGAGYQQPPQFVFNGLNQLKPEMIEEATRNAREVAAKFAEDSESRLGKIRSASQGQFSIDDRDSTTPHIKKVRVVSTVEYYLAD
ncbi:MAG: SIMPL domain-containing protein [Acidobacteria bacterium]|nr:MAG: SIMPL domain-containing protein [Acidobacteriota bacterium]REK05584.1 MAG: SIMPL domain-containing protein [Acidobacteriota bacterium]